MSTHTTLDVEQVIIPLHEAQARITHWREDQSKLIDVLKDSQEGHLMEGLPMLHVKAFTFKYQELAELIDKIRVHNDRIPETEAANRINGLRFYLGVKDYASDALSPAPCLVITGVSEFYPHESMGGDDVICIDDLVNPSIIYDFSYPCPSTCGNEGHTIMDYTSSPCEGSAESGK